MFIFQEYDTSEIKDTVCGNTTAGGIIMIFTIGKRPLIWGKGKHLIESLQYLVVNIWNIISFGAPIRSAFSHSEKKSFVREAFGTKFLS